MELSKKQDNMKKLIVAICAVIVAVTAVAQYKAISCFNFEVRLDFCDDDGEYAYTTIVGVENTDLGVLVRSQVKAEDILSNLDNLSEIEVCSAPFCSDGPTYDYGADNLTDAVHLLIKAIKAN